MLKAQKSWRSTIILKKNAITKKEKRLEKDGKTLKHKTLLLLLFWHYLPTFLNYYLIPCCRRIAWVCLTILWIWRLKGWFWNSQCFIPFSNTWQAKKNLPKHLWNLHESPTPRNLSFCGMLYSFCFKIFIRISTE